MLQRPVCGWMLGDVEVHQPPRAMLDYHQNVEQSECRRDRYEEVAGDDRASVIVQESRPTLITACATWRSLRHVLAHGTRRDPQTKLQQQLVCNSFLAP